jgi:hypothetical protein
MHEMKQWGVLLLLAVLWLGSTVNGAEQENTAQSPTVAEAKQLNKRVVELYNAGRYDEAIPLAERLLAIVEKELGAEDPAVADVLNNLAKLY